jgi:hypothetical protein
MKLNRGVLKVFLVEHKVKGAKKNVNNNYLESYIYICFAIWNHVNHGKLSYECQKFKFKSHLIQFQVWF